MAALNRESILGASDMRVQRVLVPEWGPNGAEVFVRRFSVSDWKAVNRSLQNSKAGGAQHDALDFDVAVFLHAVSDEKGQRLFTEADMPALLERDFRVIRRVGMQAMQFNQLDSEELEKKSQTTPSGASPSG